MRVTRRGQITIPKDFRGRFGIRGGSVLLVEATRKGILVRPLPALEDLAGFLAKDAFVEELKRELDRTHAEED